MNNTNLLIIAILSSILLTSCSNNSKIDRLSSELQILNSRVEQLSHDLNKIRTDVHTVQDDSARTNKHLV
ncbi:LPP leucine zipper domain-containing protein [Candidatus Pantoea carbekii]|uniref:Lipoprotein leucine-zipper domain-containing protein n=1 Tax=Candidatus Pantoea carbekii TaxID=1235990 RepID=U3U387_9GAMM|nr:LPP leucine zipper domain-containing protein [Candidatus Pantoea carbekii]AKC32095.1 murein lipoprotein [Candidatus Pantoea carbekii]BAO00621.1 hypothetical protein HHS_06510 [Candidatus Pantoea carbekii]